MEVDLPVVAADDVKLEDDETVLLLRYRLSSSVAELVPLSMVNTSFPLYLLHYETCDITLYTSKRGL